MTTAARPIRRAGLVAATLALALLSPATAGSPPAELSALLGREGPAAGTYGVCVADAATGEVLYERDASALRIPASTMKVVTSGAAMLELGRDYRFRTEIRAASPPDGEGAIAGDLVILGGGDPALTAAREPGGPDGGVEELARELARAGVRRVDGSLVVDDGRFDRVLRGAGWPGDQLDRSYCAPVGALTLERNCVTVRVEPGAAAGEAGRVRLLPGTAALTVANEIVTSAVEKEQSIVLFVTPGEATLHVRGKIWVKCGGYEAPVAVPDPSSYAGDVFRRALVRAGISVAGDVVRGAGRGAECGVVLAARETSLLDVLTEMNRESENLFAECVLKTLGAVRAGEGSFGAGAAVTARIAERIGVPDGQLRQADGSGLSRENLVSPLFLVRLLSHLYQGELRIPFIETLAIAGTAGTLEKRMKDLGADVRAKTGTIRGVSALAGYVRTASGRVLAFAFLENDRNMAAAQSRQVQDRMCRILHDGY